MTSWFERFKSKVNWPCWLFTGNSYRELQPGTRKWSIPAKALRRRPLRQAGSLPPGYLPNSKMFKFPFLASLIYDLIIFKK